MKIFISVLKLLLGLVLIFGGLLGVLTLIDFKPDEKLTIDIENKQTQQLALNQELTMTSFNIGYAGLDQDQDFFADGGSKSRAESLERVNANLTGIWDYLKGVDFDFLLLQEVDLNSSRSFNVDQLDFFKNKLPDFSYVYGVNYRVPWVPVPLANPMGKVESGIITFSKCAINKAYRYDLPGKEKWPVQIFELDRCFTESRLPVAGGGELVLINLHLSAFDAGGLIRQEQLSYLKAYMASEYAKGNHIILGGDWNHNLPGSDPYSFGASEEWPFWLQNLPEDFELVGFNWASDSETPTVRTLAEAYQPGFNFLAIIDGFLVSDNVEIVNVKTSNQRFAYSDHNPVTLTFKLIDSSRKDGTSMGKQINEIYIAGGCFWGVEKYFKLIPGVVATTVGYANGNTVNPTYADVTQRNTGHAETVHVKYDSAIVSLQELLDKYFMIIDPTAVNRQGNDIGVQYRTGVYYVDANDEPIIIAALEDLQEEYSAPIAIEVEPLDNYYLAEEYHQNYLEKNPDGYCHIAEKLYERAGD